MTNFELSILLKGKIQGFQIRPMNLENKSCGPEEQAKGFWFQWYVQL
jgi:hypothetical protein